jgi:hypothetical protein
VTRVARFFLVPNPEKMYQMNTNEPNGHKISHMSLKYWQIAIKYINIFQSKAPQNLPELGFLV